MLDEDLQQFHWRVYMANTCWSIGAAHFGREYMPVFTDIIDHHKPDDRSGEQIVDDLAAKLRRRIRERGENK